MHLHNSKFSSNPAKHPLDKYLIYFLLLCIKVCMLAIFRWLPPQSEFNTLNMTWLFSFSMLSRCYSTWTSAQNLSKLLCWCKVNPRLVSRYHKHVLGSNIPESSPGGSPSLSKSSPATIFISFRAFSSSAFAWAWALMISSSALSASASRLLYSARSCHRHGWMNKEKFDVFYLSLRGKHRHLSKTSLLYKLAPLQLAC